MFQPTLDAGYRYFELSVVYDAQTRLFYWDISPEVGRFSREISRGLREFCDFAKTRKQEMFLVSFSLRGSCNDPASDSIPAASSSSDCSEVSESVAAQFMGLVLMLLRSCVVPTSVALTRTLGEIFTTNRNVFLFLRNPPFFVPLKYKELFRRDEIFRHTVEANDFKSLQIQARIHAQSRFQRPATLNFLSFSMRSDGSDFPAVSGVIASGQSDCWSPVSFSATLSGSWSAVAVEGPPNTENCFPRRYSTGLDRGVPW